VRQGLGQLGSHHSFERVHLDQPAFHRVGEERSNRGRLSSYRSPGVASGVEKCEIATTVPPIDIIEALYPGPIAVVEELAKVPLICLDGVGRQPSMIDETAKVGIDIAPGPDRDFRDDGVGSHPKRLFDPATWAR
jgi:hypothetical protein